MSEYSLQFAYAQRQLPQTKALFKQEPDDFQVRELLGFDMPDEQKAEHHWLYVRKKGANTEFVARQLARFADVPPRQVSYSGIKDRNAVTEQWFSVQLPATTEIDWNKLHHDEFSIIQSSRQGRKLRRGTHAANQFEIRLRQVTAPEKAEEALHRVAACGVPNYFGEQRFGHGGGNLEKALAMFTGKKIRDRNLRSLLLSSARSYIFNHYLSERISRDAMTPLNGDIMLLAGSRSFFVASRIDDEIKKRLEAHDIELSGPLWGRGESPATNEALVLETQLAERFPEFCSGLEKAGLKQERRALWLRPAKFSWDWQQSDCFINMELPAGAYATSVLRELFQLEEKAV